MRHCSDPIHFPPDVKSSWLFFFVIAFTGTEFVSAEDPMARPQSPDTIRVAVRSVTVPTAVVSADGKFIRDLQAADFLLYDNDHVQKVRLEYADQPLSLAIVVQATDSVQTWLPQVRRVASTIEALVMGAGGEVSLTGFGAEVSVIQPLTSDTAAIDRAFRSLATVPGAGIRTLDAVVAAARQLEQVSPTRRRVVLVIAQSGDVGSVSSLRDALRQLEIDDIAVHSLVIPRVGKELIGKTVAIKDVKGVFSGDDTGIMGVVDLGKLIPEIYRGQKAVSGQDDLTVLTSEMGGRRIPFRKLRDLEEGLSLIAEELHTEYVLSYTPEQHDSGYHWIRVQTNLANVIVRVRPGYYVTP